MDYKNALPAGTILRHNSYRIEKIIGQGGFGITYLAHDLNLDRKVAIKEFFPKLLCQRDDTTSNIGTVMDEALVSKLKAKFLKEARNIAKFDSPGIIKIHAAFEENETAYYVMDFIEGMSLADMVKRNGPLDEDRAIHYIGSVGRALNYIHERNINHLDVKPANIMVRESDDQAILIDFGLSKRYDKDNHQTSNTPNGVSRGFAPMEQYRESGIKEFSPQTDLYSLAASLYYLLSGVVPPEAQDLIDQELIFPAGIPPRLMAPIEKAMAPARKNRHESVQMFLDEIGAVDTTLVDKAASLDSYTNNTHEHTSNKKWLWIGGVVSMIIIAVVAGLFMFKPSAEVTGPYDDVIKIVKDRDWKSPLGESLYSGMVNTEELEKGNLIPNGKGKAAIKSGELAGCVYEGEFVNGLMSGRASYTLPSGDRFVGTFKDNHYEKGRYVISATGEYFEGTFKDGQPDKGKWYNKEGVPL